MQTDKTIEHLEHMNPQLIATEEFHVEHIRDETTGKEEVRLSAKSTSLQQDGENDEHSRAHFKQAFQTYKQSEPMNFDDAANNDRVSVSKPTVTADIRTEIDGQYTEQ